MHSHFPFTAGVMLCTLSFAGLLVLLVVLMVRARMSRLPWFTFGVFVLQLIAQKTTLLADVETIAVGLLIVLLGSRFKAGWRTHTQQIAIGLSTASISQLAIQGLWQNIVRTAIANPSISQSMADRTRII